MLKVIYIKQLTDLLKEKRIYVMILLAGMMMIYLPFKMFLKISFDKNLLTLAIDFYFLFYSILFILFLAYSANYQLFLQEKVSNTIHSLLSTPLNIKTIWLGKTLAILTVGYILSIILSFAMLIIINHSIISAQTLFPSTHGLISLLVINPIICLFLIGFIGIVTMLSKDETKIRIGFYIFIGALFYFLKPNKFNIEFSFIIYQIIVIILLFVITKIGLKFLSNEKVILSID